MDEKVYGEKRYENSNTDKNIYGEKIKAFKLGRYEDGKFRYIYLPQIEVNGKMCCISDNSTKSTSIEKDTKAEAIKEAGIILSKMKSTNKEE